MKATRHLHLAAPDRDMRLIRLVPLVAGWCARLGGGHIDADAAASDVLEVLVRRYDAYDPARSLEGWAWGITVRVVRDHRRAGWWRRWIPGATIEPRASGSASGPAEQAELTALVQAILGSLSELHREVLVLHDLEERPALEVAEILGIPEGTVRSRARLARAAFKAEAERRGLSLSNILEEPNDG
jgi:RNA polymerase sigma-70 factor (ECF subfamily)